MKSPILPGKKHLLRFRSDDKGSVAMILGLLIVPMMIMIGFAIDFLRATNYRSKAAEALDIALLMTAQQYAYDKTIDVTSTTQANFNANWVGQTLPPPTISAQALPDNNIKGTIASTIPTTFMQIIGHDQMSIDVTSQVTANTKNLELVLVLDNTGSMNINNRIGTLRTAASDLVTTVMGNNGTANNVKVGIVPFTQYVNVGTDKAGQSWLDVPDPIHHDGCRNRLEHPEMCDNPGTPGTPYPCPNGEGVMGICYSGGSSPSGCPPEAYVYSCKNPHDHIWKGCVGSRNSPKNTEDSSYGTKVPGIIDIWSSTPYYCPSKITALTDNQSNVLSGINGMTGLDDDALTYIPHGLMWGWRVLSKSQPFNEGEAYTNTNVKKVMVLMTDGENTIYPVYPKHDNTGGNAAKKTIANGLTATACANIKAKNIKIYTVAFEVTDPVTKTLLENCATDPENYYDATSASALTQAFRDITLELINLRVAK